MRKPMLLGALGGVVALAVPLVVLAAGLFGNGEVAFAHEGGHSI